MENPSIVQTKHAKTDVQRINSTSTQANCTAAYNVLPGYVVPPF